MAGFLGGNSGSSNQFGRTIIYPDNSLLDPVSKLRVSTPQSLIDSDFEYGLQPTKWETVELINNTPSFFSKSGDTTIPNISQMVTLAGSTQVTVTTTTAHGLSVGIPINVQGSNVLTCDGAYIIASIPDSYTFTYQCKATQTLTQNVFNIYTYIITGQFFQGSQIRIADTQGIVTDASTTSNLTVTTNAPHGFLVGTPFYLLNLNSTISQQFDASNSSFKTFDSSNSATAQTFDGSNTLTTYPISLDNKPTTTGTVSNIVTVNTTANTITVTHTTENFTAATVGTPLYYNVSSASGYFATNPRGVVFLLTIPSTSTSASTFSVSAVPNGSVISIPATVTGTFQLATSALTFAGNNTDTINQTVITLTNGNPLTFDGSNSTGATGTVNSFSGTSILITNNAGTNVAFNWFVGRMVKYASTGTAATGLSSNTTYWVTNVVVLSAPSPGLIQIQVAATPGGSSISISGGTGTQTFQAIDVSIDKDYFCIPAHGLTSGDMVKYSYPSGGAITFATFSKTYAYALVTDINNFQLNSSAGLVLTSADVTPTTISVSGTSYKVYAWKTPGTYNFTVSGTGSYDYLVVGGGGGAGMDMGGGGGAGGYVAGSGTITSGTYQVVVGSGGTGAPAAGTNGQPGGHQYTISATSGSNSSLIGGSISWIANGGGYGGSSVWTYTPNNGYGASGGSAGGNSGYSADNSSRGANAATQPSRGYGYGNNSGPSGGQYYSSGGGGAGGVGAGGGGVYADGGVGIANDILGTSYYWAGGGGGAAYTLGRGGNGGAGGGGGGSVGTTTGGSGLNNGAAGGGGGSQTWTNTPGGNAGANTGGGGGGGGHYNSNNKGGDGGSGIVVIRVRA
jgi:hypothetical protein